MKQSILKLFSIACIIFLVILGYYNLNSPPNFLFTVTNIIIILISVFKLLIINKNISIISIIHVFILFFFGLSPIYQLNNNFYTWGVNLTIDQVLLTNICVILILILLHFTSRPFFKKEKLPLNNNNSLISFTNQLGLKINISYQLFLLFIVICLFLYFFKSYSYNYINLFFRLNDSDLGFTGNATFYLFISYFIRPLIFNAFLLYIFCVNKNKLILFLLTFIAILTVFPTGVPRFFASTMYLTLFYVITLKYYKINLSVLFLLMLGLIFIFPFLDIFRWVSSGENIYNYVFNLDLQSGNFDAFGMFTLALNEGTIVYGSNVITAVFFFIPRVFWPGKEIGSGAKISEELSLTLDNISMPFFAEGYLSFGIIGILFFTFFIAFITYKFDNLFYKKLIINKHISNPIFLISYLNIVFLFFFVMRGDLLSSYAYLIGISFSNFILYLFSKRIF